MRFADTSFWIGLQVVRDHRHVDATRLWQQDQSPVCEPRTWCWAKRGRGCGAGQATAPPYGFLIKSGVRVGCLSRWSTTPLTSGAWAWLRLRDERTYSYVDATSFEIMRRERINEALAFRRPTSPPAGFNRSQTSALEENSHHCSKLSPPAPRHWAAGRAKDRPRPTFRTPPIHPPPTPTPTPPVWLTARPNRQLFRRSCRWRQSGTRLGSCRMIAASGGVPQPGSSLAVPEQTTGRRHGDGCVA